MFQAPTVLIRSRSREYRRSGAFIGPGAPLDLLPPVRAAPDRGRTPPTSFPRAPAWAGYSFTR